jgi:hypothetical protein
LGTGGPALQKEVNVKYSTRAGAGKDRPWSLCWEPIGGGPYPRFEGQLTIDTAECSLVIEGEYTPPLGAAGQAFDLVVGALIASITAREFLRSVAEQMQHQHALEQVLDLP